MAEKNTGGVGRRKTPIVAKKTSTEMAGKIKKHRRLLPAALWQGSKDLNPRHAVLETAALPTELDPYDVVGLRGLEPRTVRL